MAELYLETSFISACVTNRRDVLSSWSWVFGPPVEDENAYGLTLAS